MNIPQILAEKQFNHTILFVCLIKFLNWIERFNRLIQKARRYKYDMIWYKQRATVEHLTSSCCSSFSDGDRINANRAPIVPTFRWWDQYFSFWMHHSSSKFTACSCLLVVFASERICTVFGLKFRTVHNDRFHFRKSVPFVIAFGLEYLTVM